MRKFSEIILELSFNAKSLILRLQGLSAPINLHLMKLYMMPNCKNRDHWFKELNGWFDDISSYYVKPNKKMLSKDTYYRILFDEPFGDIDEYLKTRYIERLKDTYPNEKIEVSLEEFEFMIRRMSSFYLEMCELISTRKYNGKETLLRLLEKHEIHTKLIQS